MLAALLLLLGACVEHGTSGSGADRAIAMGQPAIATDASIYGARSDERFTVPAVPIDRIPEKYHRQVVSYPSDQPPGTIIIDPTNKLLYYVLGDGQAIRYGISVGREGFSWSGVANVSNKRHWPTWTPPREMIARQPSLEKWKDGQPGGPTNPLGSRAIYLATNGVDYGYRIHGTPDWQTIGRNASSGCFRMINQDVMDLFERVKGGERVIVLTARGEIPQGLSIPRTPTPKVTPPKTGKKDPAAGKTLPDLRPPPYVIAPVIGEDAVPRGSSGIGAGTDSNKVAPSDTGTEGAAPLTGRNATPEASVSTPGARTQGTKAGSANMSDDPAAALAPGEVLPLPFRKAAPDDATPGAGEGDASATP